MRFGGKVEHCGGPAIVQAMPNPCAVTNIPMNEPIVRIVAQSFQIERIARISQTIEIDHSEFTALSHGKNEIAADKTGATGY